MKLLVFITAIFIFTVGAFAQNWPLFDPKDFGAWAKAQHEGTAYTPPAEPNPPKFIDLPKYEPTREPIYKIKRDHKQLRDTCCSSTRYYKPLPSFSDGKDF